MLHKSNSDRTIIDKQFTCRTNLPDGLVFPLQFNEQFVDFIDFGVLLLSLEVDELVELSEAAQIGVLHTMIPLEQTFNLVTVFGLLDRDFQSLF